MNNPRNDYVIVRYGRSTLLARTVAGGRDYVAIARFDSDNEARSILAHVVTAQEVTKAAQ